VPPVGAVVVNTTLPVSQRETLLAAGAEGRGFIVIITDFLATDKHPLVRLLDATQYVVVALTIGVV
jgi:hypothetical protein